MAYDNETILAAIEKIPAWKELLGLQAWEIRGEIGRKHQMATTESRGSVFYIEDDEMAVVRILDAGDFNRAGEEVNMEGLTPDPDVLVVHELLHLVFPGSDDVSELGITRVAKALTALVRGNIRLKGCAKAMSDANIEIGKQEEEKAKEIEELKAKIAVLETETSKAREERDKAGKALGDMKNRNLQLERECSNCKRDRDSLKEQNETFLSTSEYMCDANHKNLEDEVEKARKERDKVSAELNRVVAKNNSESSFRDVEKARMDNELERHKGILVNLENMVAQLRDENAMLLVREAKAIREAKALREEKNASEDDLGDDESSGDSS